jgi:flavin reductase (DIM6/NTAB) family NADH-FMN oxidoreductase RutF
VFIASQAPDFKFRFQRIACRERTYAHPPAGNARWATADLPSIQLQGIHVPLKYSVDYPEIVLPRLEPRQTKVARATHEPMAATSDDSHSPHVDVAAFKAALGSFATGVTLATTGSSGEVHGVTANAVMSVSLDPPLVLLSIQQGTRMYAALRSRENFALSVLSKDQLNVARYFADSSRPHGNIAFEQFPYHLAVTGAPLLDGAIAHVDCRIVDVYPAGDHVLFIGRAVFVASSADHDPLMYFRGELG